MLLILFLALQMAIVYTSTTYGCIFSREATELLCKFLTFIAKELGNQLGEFPDQVNHYLYYLNHICNTFLRGKITQSLERWWRIFIVEN